MSKPKQKTIFRCSFCGKLQTEVKTLIKGEEGNICDFCVSACNKVLVDKKINNEDWKNSIINLSPKIIKKKLDEYVIGQGEVKEILSVAVYTHYKRLINNYSYDPNRNNVEIEKANILLLGSTGTGKTLIASTLAKILDVPFAVADATTVTEAGYVGDDVENILLRLIQKADFNIQHAQRGIIFIDEIDKISRKSESTSVTRDVSGEGVQQALLKIIEGTISSVPTKGGRKHPQSTSIQIDTKDILFICGGAFVGIDEIVKSRLDKKTVGFRQTESVENYQNDSPKYENWNNFVGYEDLLKFGLIPELVGRLPIITSTKNLTKSQLKEILTTPKNSIIKQYKKIFELEGIELIIDNKILNHVVEYAYKFKTGARSLRFVMEKSIYNLIYACIGTNKKEVSLSKEMIDKVVKDVLPK